MIEQVVNTQFVFQQFRRLGEYLTELLANDEQRDAFLKRHNHVSTEGLKAALETVRYWIQDFPFPSERDLLFIPRNLVISIFQSVFEEYLELREPDKIQEISWVDSDTPADRMPEVEGPEHASKLVQEEFWPADPSWIAASFASALTLSLSERRFNPQPAPPLCISDKARLVLVGDWGTGIPQAQRLALQIRRILDEGKSRGVEQHVIHVGDVYYAGFAWEYQKRFLDFWPVTVEEADTITSWCLAGNHDMYSGGAGYYDFLLKDPRFKRQAGSSFFRLYNRYWDILALDTAWGSSITDPQLQWLESAITGTTRNVMLLSHHYPFSLDEADRIRDIEGLGYWLRDRRISAWFWGHEHHCLLYEPTKFLKYGRCIGNGGIPTRGDGSSGRRDSYSDDSFFGETVPSALIAASGQLAFAILDFQSPDMRVRYVGEDGRELAQERMSVTNFVTDTTTTEIHVSVGRAAASPPVPQGSPADDLIPVSPQGVVHAGGSSRGVPTDDAGGNLGATVPPPPVSVFPRIDVSDEHPVQYSLVTITVSVELQRDPKTTGIVLVPADDKPHVFDVHLLLGKESHWGQLTFQRPKGTGKAAEFVDIRVPLLEPDDHDVVPDRKLYEIYVNFYLENRWCGEAARYIEVRSSTESPSLAVIPTPEVPAWRKDLLVVPGTPPPDLLIRIKQVGSLEFEWHLFSPYLSFSKDVGQFRKSLIDPPYRYVKDHFEIFSGTELSNEQIDKLHSHCDLIYEAAPRGFHKAYRDLCAEVAKDASGRTHLGTIQIISDEAFIPWELMRVSDPSDSPAFEPEILCLKHCVGRWIAKDSNQLRNSLEVHRISVSASDYKTLNVPKVAALEWAVGERELLVSKPYKATPVPLQLPALNEFLRNGSAEMIHFSCHGNTDVQVPEKATLKTEDDPVGLVATQVSMPEVRAGAGRCHPVVFLNACQAAEVGQVIGMVFGWPEAFLRMGATACIAPLWKITDSRAKEIAGLFYEEALRGKKGKPPTTLGETLRNIRAQWKEKRSLTHLGYVLYGDPTTKLTWKPAATTPNPNQ